MKYSKTFGKTNKLAERDMVFASHKLLYRGGFVRESTAGRYYFLPLGQRVMDKIQNVVEEEMNAAGAQKMLTPILHPLELWEETNRTSSTGFELMKVEDRRGAEFALGGTAEEMFVDLVRKLKLSYKDLPFNIYQFSMKFRDELRARGGLLRVREFVMKDAYSFDRNEEEFKKTYDRMAKTYTRIFERLGLTTRMVESDNGYIGGEYCHEFIVDSEIGESTYFVAGDYAAHQDVAKFKREDVNLNEEKKEMEIIDQPEWVQTMEDNEKHYNLPKNRFLKNVVYKNRNSNEIIIAVIRGDLEVNKLKLEHILGTVGELEEATDDDLQKIGTKRGYVHSWGHEGVRYIGDVSLTTVVNFVGGQKEEKTDSVNVNYGRDFECDMLSDIALAQDGYIAENGETLSEKKGIEVGNIFQLGYHYTKLMKGATFTDEDGKQKEYYMGCYGIGLGRTMAAIVEKYNDEKGIMWPKEASPYDVHLITLDGAKDAENIYKELEEKGITVLWDDRDASAGQKFSDSDLIGIPVRVILSQKTGEKLEFKRRDSTDTETLSMDDLLSRIRE